MAYIDNRKDFDSVPHDYLTDIDIYKICSLIVNFLKYTVSQWLTILY
jgi:hypothetical protein